jgi:hypothetical protein
MVVAAGCAAAPGAPLAPPGNDLTVRSTGTPFVQVTAGEVTGLVPEHWIAAAFDTEGPRHGFVASPRPDPFAGAAPHTGLTVTWIDASEVGVPSDFFYLAASGPLLSELFGRKRCRVMATEIYVDREPDYLAGGLGSPGDFVARGHGTCVTPLGIEHRWSYFVAAPGFGPARAVGIPRSGLYVAAAVTRASPYAPERLQRLLGHVRFAGDGIGDLVRSVREL